MVLLQADRRAWRKGLSCVFMHRCGSNPLYTLLINKETTSKLPLECPLTDSQFDEASALIEGFSGREIKGAILDMLLSKAEKGNPSVRFSFEDLVTSLARKMRAMQELKAQEEQRIKKKIERKTSEKAREAEALKVCERKPDAQEQDGRRKRRKRR